MAAEKAHLEEEEHKWEHALEQVHLAEEAWVWAEEGEWDMVEWDLHEAGGSSKGKAP